MDQAALLTELFARVDGHVEQVLDGLSTDELVAPPAPGANTIGWLLWHLTRVQDHHVADLLGRDQIWVEPGRAERFGLAPDPENTGYGHSPEQVASVRPEDAAAVAAYYDAVARRTREFLASVIAADLDRVVDERWDPPVTLGVRLVSVADDDIQHAGQAAYVRGLLRAGDHDG
jgi:uncharacterized damage-inducible protein DinB